MNNFMHTVLINFVNHEKLKQKNIYNEYFKIELKAFSEKPLIFP